MDGSITVNLTEIDNGWLINFNATDYDTLRADWTKSAPNLKEALQLIKVETDMFTEKRQIAKTMAESGPGKQAVPDGNYGGPGIATLSAAAYEQAFATPWPVAGKK